MTVTEATERGRNWLDQYLSFFHQMLKSGNAVGNLVSDAHLAAFALEHNGVLHSTDADFSRFRGLKWKNPVSR